MLEINGPRSIYIIVNGMDINRLDAIEDFTNLPPLAIIRPDQNGITFLKISNVVHIDTINP